MKKYLLPFLVIPVGAGFDAEAKEQTPPNIVLFLVDDMGWQDTSVPFWKVETPFNRIYETPNMERLASRGVKFTQSYASSVSSPTRCSLLTGSNAARHRVTNWTLQYNTSTDGFNDELEMPQWNLNGICEEEGIEKTFQSTPFPRLLQQNGYHTIHCGKAHFGSISTPGENPLNLGFDVNIAGHAAGGLTTYLGERNFGYEKGTMQSPFNVPGLEQYHGKDIFVTEALTLEAMKALDKATTLNKPFFLYMAHYAIHIPIDKDNRFFEKYKAKGMSDIEAKYAGLIEGMDKSLGDLMDYLDRNNLTDNTVILFMSDNGGLSASSRTTPLHVQNFPLNSGKGSAYEGGIREPMIVSWPGKVAPNSKCDRYVMIEDFYPSILEIAGVKHYETVQKIDGKSFVPLLIGKGKDPSKGRALFWNFPNEWGPKGPGIGATCTIRKGDWKLIYYYASGQKELFNIREDISERNNLVAQEPKRVARLSNELTAYLKESGAQRPKLKRTGNWAPWPNE